MSIASRISMLLLLGLCAAAVSAADVSVRQFTGQVQPVLNPQLSAWVATQSAVVTRSAGPVDAAALKDAEQDIRQIATEIERNADMKQALRDVAAQARKATAPDIFAANPTLMTERQRELDALRKALEDLRGSGDVTSELAFELQRAVTRASQAMQQLAAMLAVYSMAANTIIGNIKG